MLEGMKLVKVDRNGTKYYEGMARCGKCGGSGQYLWFGVCFDCNGSGKVFETAKEYTPEYQAKLDERAKKRAEKKAEEIRAAFYEKMGLNEAGECWIVLGDTFSIKDGLKAEGARYCNELGWHFDHETNHKSVKLSCADRMQANAYGGWDWADGYELAQYVKELKQAAAAADSTSEWVGAVGDKIQMELTLKRTTNFDTQYGTTYVHTFEDSEGNLFVWKSSTVDLFDYGNQKYYDAGTKFNVRGTIKDHSSYNGIKQTLITRCKIA